MFELIYVIGFLFGFASVEFGLGCLFHLFTVLCLVLDLEGTELDCDSWECLGS